MKVRCRWERRWLVRDNHYQGAAVASCGVELWNDDFWTGPHYIKSSPNRENARSLSWWPFSQF